mgnify:CR=1 FL=1
MNVDRDLRVPVILALSAAFLVWLGQATDIDLNIASLSYDASRGQFPLRDAWLTRQLFHAYVKFAVVTIGAVFLACALIDVFRPATYWARETGLRIRTVASCAVLVPATISLLKQMSRLHCPWDIGLFGGVEPYFRLLDLIPRGVSPGRCFPAGHASGGLWLASIMVFWLPGKPRTAWATGAGMLSVGVLMGVVQQLRGAHFTTHTLWSTWIAVSIIYVAYRVLIAVEHRYLASTLRT